MSTKTPYSLRDTDSITILQIPDIFQLDEMGSVRDLYRRTLGSRGCSRCRKRKLRPGYLAPSVGAGLVRAIRNGHSNILYNALSTHYSIKGPIQLNVGPCQTLLKG